MIQKPKGTYDLCGDDGSLYLFTLFEGLMERYHYQYYRTPLFEATELFKRGVGETTDIVTKETYDFMDRGNRAMTLRPEGTAGIVRSFIENKIYGNLTSPKKIWYYGPMYRYERPQAGRFREFYQLGVEVLGSDSPMIDAEVISIPVRFYQILGLKHVKVKINTLGDQASRASYREALVNYFKPHLDTLCPDCQARFKTNPLRILDCKVDAESALLKGAPSMNDYLTAEAQERFLEVQKYLKIMNIEYELDANLVRGLDYYTSTVFEVVADISDLGAAATLCGGGRYDNLVKDLGGPVTSAMGFAIGMERLLTVLNKEQIKVANDDKTDLYLIPLTVDQNEFGFSLAETLRLDGFRVEMDYQNRSLKANFKEADRLKAQYIIIVGEDEIKDHLLTIKNNKTKQEDKVNLDYVVAYLEEKLQDNAEEDLNHV